MWFDSSKYSNSSYISWSDKLYYYLLLFEKISVYEWEEFPYELASMHPVVLVTLESCIIVGLAL